MNITGAKYQHIYFGDGTVEVEHAHLIVTIEGQDLCVPKDPMNRHYAEVLRQVELGELTIADAD